MAVDYSIYDFKKSYTVHEAALAWAETEYEPENRQKAYQAVYDELLRDVKAGSLQCRIKRDIRKNWINWESDYSDYTDWSTAEIWAEDLQRWAEARGQKPKFLFPDMRPAVVATPAKEKSASPKPKQRENELHTLIEKVYLVLMSEFRRPPDADEMLSALAKREEEFDTGEIIQEIKGKCIYWIPAGGKERTMGRKALQNFLSQLNKKHVKQRAVKKIPA